MEKRDGVFYIPGKVNGLPLQFIFDTGASDVNISLTEALFMLKNGYISQTDLGGTSYAQVADGSIVENTEVTLREIEVGGIKLKNIKAYVSNSLNAPLLFGQTAIQKLGPIQINGTQLVISNGTMLPSNEDAFALYHKAYQESEAENFDNAINLSEKALKIATDKQLRAMLYDNIAYAYYNSGRKEEAITALNKAIGEDLTCEQPAYNLGVYYFEMGQVDKALRALNLFIQRFKGTQERKSWLLHMHIKEIAIAKMEKMSKQRMHINKVLHCHLTLNLCLDLQIYILRLKDIQKPHHYTQKH